mmetsp:Transcript_101342/g.180137  ORF Transcript_101342/g.180137 Transcript_101342/m.180137 type:complete len:214 (-) Transcript_101342:115-756(-)
MGLRLLPQSKRTEYGRLRYSYPEAYKKLMFTLDNTSDLVNTHIPVQPPRPKTTHSLLRDAAVSSLGPSAEELLEMSHSNLVEHLEKRASQGIRRKRKELQRSNSSPAVNHAATATAGFASGEKAKPRISKEREQEILQVARDRNACGSLFRTAPGWEKVGFLGERTPLVVVERTRTPLPQSWKDDMAAEKDKVHQISMKMSKSRSDFGGIYEG